MTACRHYNPCKSPLTAPAVAPLHSAPLEHHRNDILSESQAILPIYVLPLYTSTGAVAHHISWGLGTLLALPARRSCVRCCHLTFWQHLAGYVALIPL